MPADSSSGVDRPAAYSGGSVRERDHALIYLHEIDRIIAAGLSCKESVSARVINPGRLVFIVDIKLHGFLKTPFAIPVDLYLQLPVVVVRG